MKLICYTALLTLLLGFALNSPTLAQDSATSFEKYEKSFEKIPQEEDEEEKKIVRINFASFRAEFTKVCTLLETDGQKEWLVIAIRDYLATKELCVPCRRLYVTLNGACPGKKLPKPISVKKKAEKNKEQIEVQEGEGDEEAKGTPTPSPVRKAMDPSTELLDQVSRLFQDMAETQRLEVVEQYFVGISHLLSLMRATEGKDSLEIAYYSTLAEFIEAPFVTRGLLSKSEEKKSTVAKPVRTPQVSLDELF